LDFRQWWCRATGCCAAPGSSAATSVAGSQGGSALARVRQNHRPKYIVTLSAWLPRTTGARV
jgi:hypothetical protein